MGRFCHLLDKIIASSYNLLQLVIVFVYCFKFEFKSEFQLVRMMQESTFLSGLQAVGRTHNELSSVGRVFAFRKGFSSILGQSQQNYSECMETVQFVTLLLYTGF